MLVTLLPSRVFAFKCLLCCIGFMYVCLSVCCLFVTGLCVCVGLLFCLFVWLVVCLFVCLCVCMFVCLFFVVVCLFVCLCVCVFVCLCVCLFVGSFVRVGLFFFSRSFF